MLYFVRHQIECYFLSNLISWLITNTVALSTQLTFKSCCCGDLDGKLLNAQLALKPRAIFQHSRRWKVLHQRNAKRYKEVAVFKKILIICIGNICRSPTAEILLRETLASSDIEVSSAGLAALVENPIEPTARIVLEEHGFVHTAHKASQLTTQAVCGSDLILVMEQGHINSILNIAPQARGKVFLLGKWQNNREISDPYRQGKPAFVHAYALIEEAVHAWAQRLAR
ncbi:MAG: hypothetical protein CFE47_00645 [Pseudomonas sp. PGPPP1]|nr:MAG: hypothetical protein CFE47_00645 [Pseudomonas sp. PGPPP1]